jgi:hypothetical protein
MAERIFRGDTILFQFVLKDKTGAVFDLNGWQVYFAARAPGASAYQFNVEMTITDEPNGACEVRLSEVQSGDAGIYTAEVEGRNTALSRVLTFGQFTLEIVDDVRKGA